MKLYRFQIEVATGRFTLPVVILVCLSLWGISWQEWSDLASLATIAIIGYLMIETNTAFNLIRTRTTLPVSIYWLFTSVLLLPLPFEWHNLIPLAFLLVVIQLFKSYEMPHPAISIYHIFLLISIGTMAFPPFIYIVPLMWASMIPFRTINTKSFLASLLGLLTPYWFLFGYAFYTDEIPLFLAPLQEMCHLHPIQFAHLTLSELISWGYISLMLFISGVHYLLVSYMDKTRTRIYHSFLIIAGLWTFLFGMLQPQHIHVLMQIQLICTAFLSGHLFTLTRNRFSGIYFIIIFATFILLMSYNIWMQFYSS